MTCPLGLPWPCAEEPHPAPLPPNCTTTTFTGKDQPPRTKLNTKGEGGTTEVKRGELPGPRGQGRPHPALIAGTSLSFLPQNQPRLPGLPSKGPGAKHCSPPPPRSPHMEDKKPHHASTPAQS